jgi:hypothetical protein
VRPSELSKRIKMQEKQTTHDQLTGLGEAWI